MGTIAGDIIEITVNHPSLKPSTFTFYPKSGESFELDLGGFVNDDEENGIAGDGSVIVKKSRKRWSIEGVVKWDMNAPITDLEYYRFLEESSIEGEYTFTSINGTVWSAKGFPVGGNGGSMGDGTFSVKFSGGGRCTRQN